MDYLLGQYFQVFRANSFRPFEHDDTANFLRVMARYIYSKYTSTTSDLIPRYHSEADILVTAHTQRDTQPNMDISVLSMQASGSHIVATIAYEQLVIVLIHLQFTTALVEMLEAQSRLPIVVLNAVRPRIDNIVASLASGIRHNPALLGNITITFCPRQKLENDSLREVILSIPLNDSKRILSGAEDPLGSIFAWMQKTTGLKLQDMQIKAFDSRIFLIRGQKVQLELTDASDLLGRFCGGLMGDE